MTDMSVSSRESHNHEDVRSLFFLKRNFVLYQFVPYEKQVLDFLLLEEFSITVAGRSKIKPIFSSNNFYKDYSALDAVHS